MENSSVKFSTPTNAESRWRYHQYYFGNKDQERRRNGRGENHWSGSESLEWYSGKFVRDTMHGEGEYRWRYKGPEETFFTYEGRFYGNRMHGYGVMSYPDGRIFNGIFYNNVRWGPGIESNTNLQENVGLWRGHQLIRITWRPNTPSVTLDFNFGPDATKTLAEAHRTLFSTSIRAIGDVNSAIELLKQSGAAPIVASEKWMKLYPAHCNDFASQACCLELFDHEYYNNKLVELDEIKTLPKPTEERTSTTTNDGSNLITYYAWNNSEMMTSMMKHCFKHEIQRQRSGIDLATILSGARTSYKRAGKHELDCRILIMSSYLGYKRKVTELVNEENVHPDVADMLGNTALMYATCGNQVDIIHFLVEAGADVNNCNDSCCSPLSVALLRFACLSKDIPAGDMVQTLTPQPTTPPIVNIQALQEKPSEWHIRRELSAPGDSGPLTRIVSKRKMSAGYRTTKSTTTIETVDPNEKSKDARSKTITERNKTTIAPTLKTQQPTEISDKNKIPEEILYLEMKQEFELKIAELFSVTGLLNPVAYLYEVANMLKEVDRIREDKDKAPQKLNRVSNKDMAKSSPNMTRPDSEKEDLSVISEERAKIVMSDKNLSTIIQLLSDGADPRLVRCPQPALLTAVVSGSVELVRKLVQYGADINEAYPGVLNYTAVDVAVSRPLTYENLALVRAIVECGGTVDHRLKCESNDGDKLGPTLLHALLAKQFEDASEEKICCELLEILLQYDCNALAQFNGRSAMDMAMENSLEILDNIFVKSPKIDLNAVINENNQTILVKMFSVEFFKNNTISERLQTLTNLLLYGADPLLECENQSTMYDNIFVFAKKVLFDLENPKSSEARKQTNVVKKEDPKKAKKEDSKIKGPTKSGAEDIEDYRQTVYLVRDCTRIIHIRWIQAKLMKELLGIVEKFEHRHWSMILPEHKNKKPCGLWLTMPRCLEIWEILKANKKKKCNDRRVLKHILCIVHFYSDRSKTTLKLPLTAEERGKIETDAILLLREHKKSSDMESRSSLGKPYVTPELAVGAERKFLVCFECALPLPQDKILCNFCKQVSFCSLNCMKNNIEEQNVGIHPCNQNLMNKYFPTPAASATAIDRTK